MTEQWIEAGVLMRGDLRRELAKAGVEFTETKSLLTSVFVIPNTDDYLMVKNSLREQDVLHD